MAFHLPEGITFRKETLRQGFAYVFRHSELGDLGRIVLCDRPDGQCQVNCEVAGDAEDPVWPEREALEFLSPDEFNPRVEALQRAHCAR